MKRTGNFPRKVLRSDIPQLATPSGTATWVPVAHDFILSVVENSIAGAQMLVKDDYHYVSHADLRYHGRLVIERASGTNLVVGIINTSDKSEAARMFAGAQFPNGRVGFFQEIVISRKHTKNVMTGFPTKVAQATTMILSKYATLDQRYDEYKRTTLDTVHIHDLAIRGLDLGAYAASDIKKVLKAYRDGEDKTAYGFFQAGLLVLNEENENPFTLAERTHALHAAIDQKIGYDAKNEQQIMNLIAE